MVVRIGATISIENPTQALREWCEEHLVLPNPEYAKKVRMHFWVGNTPKTLALYEKRGDTLILPFGVLRDIQPFLWGHPVTSEFAKPMKRLRAFATCMKPTSRQVSPKNRRGNFSKLR